MHYFSIEQNELGNLITSWSPDNSKTLFETWSKRIKVPTAFDAEDFGLLFVKTFQAWVPALHLTYALLGETFAETNGVDESWPQWDPVSMTGLSFLQNSYLKAATPALAALSQNEFAQLYDRIVSTDPEFADIAVGMEHLTKCWNRFQALLLYYNNAIKEDHALLILR